MMNTKRILSLIALTMSVGMGFAQKPLSEEEIETTATKMVDDWQFGHNYVIWMENQQALSHYLETAPLRCPEELESVVEWSEKPHKENQSILQLKQQIYPKPGAKKSERTLALYFKDTEKAKQKFAAAEESEEMYQRLIAQVVPLIESKKKQTFTAPQGELTYFYYHLGGGMVRRPASQATLERLKDGTYRVALDTEAFNKLDTIPVTQAHVDTIRQMLIEGEVYKMPSYYDQAIPIMDAPSGRVSVKFTDASFSCSDLPPSNWGGENIGKVYRYLKALQPKRRTMKIRELEKSY